MESAAKFRKCSKLTDCASYMSAALQSNIIYRTATIAAREIKTMQCLSFGLHSN